MSIGHFDKHADEPVAEINMIPLVDVMLVLLVIFIITAPVLTHAVKIDLPKASSRPNTVDPETVTVTIDRDGRLYWNDEPAQVEAMKTRFGALPGDTVVQVRADAATPYEVIARVLSTATHAGVSRLGLVTDPGS
jgi:biopolymer transport protein ExbD